jgi:hypothetical protein
LRDAVRSIKQISRDETYRWLVETQDGETISAIDVQRAYWRGCREMQVAGSDWILEEWQSTLDALESDPMSLSDRLDWAAKKSLLDEFVESEDLNWKRDRETLQSLDLAYHNVDAEAGLYYGLVESGQMQILVSEEEIEAARNSAPTNTRAALRGALVECFAAQIRAVSWGAMLFEEGEEKFAVYLPEDEADYPQLCRSVREASNVRDLLQILPTDK